MGNRQIAINVIVDAEVKQRIEKQKIKSLEWRNFCTPDKGYNWDKSNARIDYFERIYLEVSQSFVAGHVDLKSVHEAFTNYAKAHKRAYSMNQVNRRTGEVERRQCVTPQVEMGTEQMNRALIMFVMTESEYIEIGRIS